MLKMTMFKEVEVGIFLTIKISKATNMVFRVQINESMLTH